MGNAEDERRDLDFANLRGNLALHAAVVPRLKKVNAVRSWAGTEGATPDLKHLIGRFPDHPDLVAAIAPRPVGGMAPSSDVPAR